LTVTYERQVHLAEKLASFSPHWSPRTVTQFNDCDVIAIKFLGEFAWHKHDDTDDFFLVLKSTLDIQLRDRVVILGPGEMYVVPRGGGHRPIAREEVHLLLIEPAGTPAPVTQAAPRITRLARPMTVCAQTGKRRPDLVADWRAGLSSLLRDPAFTLAVEAERAMPLQRFRRLG
jgi:mannose-6-phosphate isomerase-like protein (cupin superfamily)